jgi:hypothetical protein
VDNGRIFDFEFTGEELRQLDALGRTGNALENKCGMRPSPPARAAVPIVAHWMIRALLDCESKRESE